MAASRPAQARRPPYVPVHGKRGKLEPTAEVTLGLGGIGRGVLSADSFAGDFAGQLVQIERDT